MKISMKNPFNKEKQPMTYSDYVAPLKTIMDNLLGYVTEQNDHIIEQKIAKEVIEADIRNSEVEIENSKKTIDKLSDFVIV